MDIGYEIIIIVHLIKLLEIQRSTIQISMSFWK